MANAMIDFGLCCLFFSFTSVLSFRALTYFCAIAVLVACVCLCSSCEHGFDIHPTGGIKKWSLVLMLWSLVLVTGVGLKQ